MKIIGYLTDEKNLFLVEDGKLHPHWRNVPCGRVLDLNDHILYPSLPLISLCARDNWRQYQGNQNKLAQWLREAHHIQ